MPPGSNSAYHGQASLTRRIDPCSGRLDPAMAAATQCRGEFIPTLTLGLPSVPSLEDEDA